ncbi:MAG: PmoA family protein [Planctomycetaceae bacterium]
MFLKLTICCGVVGMLARAAAADELTISQGKASAVIRLGDEVVGTYRYAPDLQKPYLIAVSAPGSIEQLVAELDQSPAEEFAPGNKVYVAVEQTKLKSDDKNTEPLWFGDVVNVTQARDGWLRIADGSRWIAARDVVPLKTMVTRLVNLNPPVIKDRAHPDFYDHPHHKGVWNSIDEVNGIRFWAEQGKIANVSVEVTKPTGNPVEMRVVNHWLDLDGQPLLEERTLISVHANRLFAYDITFQALERPVTFEDTKEGMFAIRLTNSMREQFANGPVVNADGVLGSKDCWGRPSPWIDYVGPIERNTFGVTIMDDQKNPRKSRYHVSDYGLFSISPFGQESYTKGTDDPQPADHLTLKPHESTRYRYGLYIHRGDAVEGHVAEAYAEFAR